MTGSADSPPPVPPGAAGLLEDAAGMGSAGAVVWVPPPLLLPATRGRVASDVRPPFTWTCPAYSLPLSFQPGAVSQ
nr:hypothetical protein GCM10020092_082670 [Actinoplanes digitatis]